MPSAMDLIEILKRSEGKTLEFRRDLSSPDTALKAIVAFANTAGGTLLIGVEDKTRHVRGVSDPLELEERVANLISDRITPRLVRRSRSCPGGGRRSWHCRSIPARAARTSSRGKVPPAACTCGWARPIAAPTPS